MTRARHLLSGCAALLALMASAAPWASVQSVAAVEVSATWWDFSPPSVSLAVAAAAAWAASTLASGWSVRVLGGVQGALALTGLSLALLSLGHSTRVLADVAVRATGIDLGDSLLGDDVSWSGVGPTGVLLSMAGLVAGGILGVLGGVPGRVVASRYEPKTTQNADPWEQLSGGIDPTER